MKRIENVAWWGFVGAISAGTPITNKAGKVPPDPTLTVAGIGARKLPETGYISVSEK